MSWEERADLAEASVDPACDLACLVHDGDAEGVAAFIAALPEEIGQETAALLVTLAAMVPVDRATPSQLTAWADGRPDEIPLVGTPCRWPRQDDGGSAEVTVTDLGSGQSRASVISDDFVIVCAGTARVSKEHAYAGGTWQVTIRGVNPGREVSHAA